MGIWGYAQGLIVGALSLAGFVGGAYIGSRLRPLILSNGSHSPYAPLFALTGAFLLAPVPADRGPRPERRAAERPHRARPPGACRRPQRGARARDRLRPRHRGVRLGGGCG